MKDDPLEQQTIIDFVLEDETHIDAAARMSQVFPLVQRTIVHPIYDQLEAKLRQALGAEWEIYNCRDEFLIERYPAFSVSRKSWGEVYVAFENQTQEGTSVVGVWREKAPETSAMDAALIDAFANAGFTGEANRYWTWYQELPKERGDWNAAPALSAMLFHRDESVRYLADQLLAVHKVAAHVIDKFRGKK
jgi:hypothetical protein